MRSGGLLNITFQHRALLYLLPCFAALPPVPIFHLTHSIIKCYITDTQMLSYLTKASIRSSAPHKLVFSNMNSTRLYLFAIHVCIAYCAWLCFVLHRTALDFPRSLKQITSFGSGAFIMAGDKGRSMEIFLQYPDLLNGASTYLHQTHNFQYLLLLCKRFK